MPPSCAICAHPRRDDIHRALDAGDGVNATARAYSLAPTTLKRHLEHRPAPAPGPGRPDVDQPGPGQDEERPPGAEDDLPLGDLEGRLRQLVRTADRLRVDAERGTVKERGQVLNQCRQMVESAVALHLQLQEGRELALLQSPEWVALRTRVLELLEPHPDARSALLEGLRAYGAA